MWGKSSTESWYIEENEKLREYLKWTLEMLEHYPMEASHEGGCSPPMTPCDGGCAAAYYFHKTINEIEDMLN